MKEFKTKLRQVGNKNFTFVKTKSVHTCSHCLKDIPLGSECLTVNPRMCNRRWYCEDCVQLMLNVQRARIALDSVAFDDEGASMACLEWVSEAESELYALRE